MENKNNFIVTVVRVTVLALFMAFMFPATPASARQREKPERVRWVRVRGGLGVLKDLASSMKDMETVLDGETRSYESVIKALEGGLFSEGMLATDIAEKYGEAILAIPEECMKRTRWVYKPAGATYFSGPKVYLFFDQDNRLEDWETVN